MPRFRPPVAGGGGPGIGSPHSQGLEAAIPAAGNVGAEYYATDSETWFWDDGSFWLEQVSAAPGVGYVNHGAVAGTARPVGFTMVIWRGTVEPTNMDNSHDLYVDESP